MKPYLHLDKLILTILFILLTSSQISYAGEIFTKISSTGAELADDATEWFCVKHNITGQIWEVKTTENKDIKYPHTDPTFTLDTMFEYEFQVRNEKLCGYSDWRLPLIKELYSIVDQSQYNPAIDATYFPNTSSDIYISDSHTAESSYSNALWGLYFLQGFISGSQTDGHVRLVRGGEYSDYFDYTKLDFNGNPLPRDALEWSCVKDNLNGLIWETKTLTNINETYIFNSMVNHVTDINSQNLCGYDNWRVPSINELISIIDYNTYDYATSTVYFSDITERDNYWSSTNFSDDLSAWFAAFDNGTIFFGDKGRGMSLRLVRSDQSTTLLPTTFLPAMLFLLF